MEMPAGHGVREWRVHVGAHKTATTHLQEQLEALRGDLEARGVGFASLNQIRPTRAIDLRLRRPGVWMSGGHLRREIETRMAARVALRPIMVISEEDLLGNAASPILPGFYPRAGLRMRFLAPALLGKGRGSLWLSVRSLDRFVPAAYATALKHMALRFDSSALRARILTAPPDWSDLVARLRRAAPGVPITVWNYDDYRGHAREIAETLTGLAFGRMPDRPDPPATRTPDSAAIRAAEAVSRRLSLRERAQRIGEIYEAATGPRFALFSDAEAGTLRDLHHRQLDCIADTDGVRVLRF